MSTKFKFPEKKAVIFWPVGTGDSTTLVLKPGELAMQIDLRHLEKADDPNEPEWAIIDHLVRELPKKNGKPYLAVFALTHPDKDHIQGFSELLKKVHIGELWHTPKVFRDQTDQESICEDAKAFRKEADRRRKAILASPKNINSGDRLRVIGHDDILLEDKYKDLPADCKSRPGEKIEHVDSINLSGQFQAFIHAPFKDEQSNDKNNTSLSLNVVLWEGDKYGQFLFFGDRQYETIKSIFEITEKSKSVGKDNTAYLQWDVMLSSHHCSKSVMYVKNDDGYDEFKKDIMDYFEKYKRKDTGYIISSSHSNFTDGKGDNPPHKKAKDRYCEITKAGNFICTHEFPSKKDPVPLVFTVDKSGVVLDDKRVKGQGSAGIAAVVGAGRGSEKPPTAQIGFGIMYDD